MNSHQPFQLPTQRELVRQVIRLESVVSFPALAAMLFYLAVLVDLSASEWWYFGLSAASYGLLVTLGLEPLRHRMQLPLRRFLNGGSEHPDPEVVRAAFTCVTNLPRTMMRLELASWSAAGPLICLMMFALGFQDWLLGDRLVGVVLSAVTGGLITMSFMYFVAKAEFAPLREHLAREIPDPGERRLLIEPITLARKLQYVVAGTGVASLVFTMSVAYDGTHRAFVTAAEDGHQRLLAAASTVLAEASIEQVRAELWPDPMLAPRGMTLSVDEAGVLPGGLEVPDAESGSRHADGTLVSWLRLRDGRTAIAATPLAIVLEPVAGLGRVLAFVVVAALGLCFGISWLLAEDVRRSVAALRSEADRIADGDLRGGASLDFDDELGDLARAFEGMTVALRATVARVAGAAERLEGAVGEIGSVGRDVMAASADQMRRVGEASGLMEQIREETRGVAQFAHALGESVEESSSAILELGATGDELSDTAGVLSGRADEVSTSIEQMVRSVKQVGITTQGLAEAASDTSSSMEEMASSMRAIDTTAAKTAVLASDVVGSSESGLAKVRETIDGMHAIRDATDAAERVIRGLGRGTKEIGAILDVIDDVGDETTLLALNAAIIAAQAGEHGRAFSVVADEIKELADRVLTSTKEIGSLIQSVQSEADDAVGAIEAGSQRVARGVDLAAEAGVSLEGITRAAAESGQHIVRIVGAVREQTSAAAHVAQLMDSVSGGADEIRAAGSDQDHANEVVHRSAITMREIAQQVRRTTEEQSRGFSRIRESVENVRDAVERIDRSLHQQSGACEQVAGFLEMVNVNTHSNERSVQGMDKAMSELAREAEALREDVGRFRV